VAFDALFARDVALPLALAAYTVMDGSPATLPPGFAQTAPIRADGAALSAMNPHPAVVAMTKDSNVKDVLANLGPVAEAGNRADRNLTSWVTKARSLGATWSQIGEALNCSRQAVWERFSVQE
jgi:hypothetical protein